MQVLDEYRKAGLEYVICGFLEEGLDDTLRQMQLFADEIMQQFTDTRS